jgi:hypothetical protein
MSTKVQLGETGQAVVGAVAIPAGTVVALNASSLLVACTAAQRPIGSVQDAYAIGALATYYKGRGNQHYALAAGVAPGDYLKVSGTAGTLGPDATTGSTTASVATCGQAVSATDTAGFADVILF